MARVSKNYGDEYFLKRGPSLKFKALLYSFFIKLFFYPKSLLDIGCAEGYLVRYCSRLGIDSFGVDISQTAIAHLVKNDPNFKIGSVLKIPYSGKFEITSCLAVLEHVPKQSTGKALREIMRVTGKFAVLQICVLDNPFEKNNYWKDPTHVNVMSSVWWLKKFESLDYDIYFSVPRLGIFVFKK